MKAQGPLHNLYHSMTPSMLNRVITAWAPANSTCKIKKPQMLVVVLSDLAFYIQHTTDVSDTSKKKGAPTQCGSVRDSTHCC